MGPWYFIRVRWEELGLHDQYPITSITRPESASPSTGSKKMHAIEQQELIDLVFNVPARTKQSRV
jgi:2-oxoglutarate dehydrogenase E1 component